MESSKNVVNFSKLAQTSDLFGNPIDPTLKQESNVDFNDIFEPPKLKYNAKRKATENSTSLEPQCKQIRRKRLQFHPSAKRNDGLSGTTDMFNEYMKDVFRKVKKRKGQKVVTILARNMNVSGLVTIQKMLSDLIRRCLLSPRGRAIILPKGGRTGRINLQHIPILTEQVKYLEKVIGKVRAVIVRNEMLLRAPKKIKKKVNIKNT